MGRWRGGLTTEIHALVDADGQLIALNLTKGQAYDGCSTDNMLETFREGPILPADRAYDSDYRREMLAKRGAWANIKPIAYRANKPVYGSRSGSILMPPFYHPAMFEIGRNAGRRNVWLPTLVRMPSLGSSARPHPLIKGVNLEIIMAGHLVALLALLVQPNPKPPVLHENVLNLHVEGSAHAHE